MSIWENAKSKCDYLDSQSTLIQCSDKKCQENIIVQSVTKKMDVQLAKPAVLYTYRRVSKAKNSQDTICDKKQKICEYDDSKSQFLKCSDKNCHENENINM